MDAKDKKEKEVTIYNCSNQMVPIQIRSPGTDFFTNEMQVRILPGKSAALPEDHLNSDQIDNLRQKGLIRIR